jgi:hypothetical protein
MQFAAITVITVMAGVAVMAITVMAVATVTVIIDMATNDMATLRCRATNTQCFQMLKRELVTAAETMNAWVVKWNESARGDACVEVLLTLMRVLRTSKLHSFLNDSAAECTLTKCNETHQIVILLENDRFP